MVHIIKSNVFQQGLPSLTEMSGHVTLRWGNNFRDVYKFELKKEEVAQ